MWNRLSLKVKITVVTVFTLTVLSSALTAAAIHNTSVFYKPVEYAIAAKPFEDNSTGDRHTIANLHDLQDINAITMIDEIYTGSRDHFIAISIITAIGVVVVGALIVWLLTGRTLRPLQILTSQIEEIDESALSGEIILPPSSSEVSKLTNAFNNMLEKLDNAFASKKLFASHAAHELKTPLANILTNIEVLQMEEVSSVDDYKEVILITRDNIDRLNLLIADLLSFTAERDETRFESFSTDELFEEIMEKLKASIHERKIEVTIKGSTTLFGDKTLLEQAFMNIVQNAIRYNQECGKILISVSSQIIAIEDTGLGIPETSVQQVFEPFYCVDPSRSRELGGSGLGLSIAKQIFDKHNMKISITSELKTGTVISIELPENRA